MTGKTFQLDYDDLGITAADIERISGPLGNASDGLITSVINDVLEQARKVCNIKAEYHLFTRPFFSGEGNTIEIEGEVLHINRTIFSQLKGAETITIFLCTAGKDISILSGAEMKEGDLLKGYLYDVAGTVIAEKAADIMQAALQREMESYAMNITNRYSPGYCGWDVAEQHILFKLIPDNFCNIQLTSSALMNPVKSVSGIIGTGKNVKMNRYKCRRCDMKNCIYRGKNT